jgi:hypothetical protein
MAKWRVGNGVRTPSHPQRPVSIFTDVLITPKPFQLELRCNNSTLEMNDPMEAEYPEPTRVVAKRIYDLAKPGIVCADRTIIRRSIPRREPNAVEGLQIAGYDPEETV